MLYLIGLGLDLKDISLKALKIIKSCNSVYLETYTTTFPYKIEDLEKLLCKKVILADRQKIENELDTIITDATQTDVSILVYGDPLSATTHITILREAKKQKVKTQVIHNISIINAISETGLSLYKFGKTTSLPKFQENYKPTSFLEIIKENLSIKAHTLILVDPGLSLKDALKQIEDSDINHLLTDKEIIIFSRGGTKDQKIEKGKIKQLTSKKALEPFSIIVPGELNFSEEN
jgi:diphthine synthase